MTQTGPAEPDPVHPQAPPTDAERGQTGAPGAPGATIRPTARGDRAAVLEVVRSAFAHGAADGAEEVEVTERTWASGAASIDLVAVDHRGAVIGHILAAVGRATENDDLMGIAPVSVAPASQAVGIGSLLVREVVQRARDGGVPGLVLLGNPAFYGRFGFVGSAAFDLTYEPVGAGSPYFQVLELTPGAVRPGTFTYCFELDA